MSKKIIMVVFICVTILLVVLVIKFTQNETDIADSSNRKEATTQTPGATYENHVKSNVYEKITVTTDFINLADSTTDGRYIWEMSSVYVTLGPIKENHKIELTGKVNDDVMYIVFRMNDKTIGDYYTYYFFYYASSEEFPEFNPKNEEDRWIICGRAIRIAKRLSTNDFSNITVGSNINEVIEIDPITSLSLANVKKMSESYPQEEVFDTFHYTDEGILRITFGLDSVNNEYLVTEIELNSSFEVEAVDDKDNESTELKYPILLKINPDDLP